MKDCKTFRMHWRYTSLDHAQVRESSNARELLATLYSFKAAIGFLQGMRVDQQMDNMGAVQALGGIIPDKPDEIYGGTPGYRNWPSQ